MCSRQRILHFPPVSRSAALLSVLLFSPAAAPGSDCGGPGLHVLVAGSGNGRLSDNRAAASYLVSQNDKASILVNIGVGSSMHLARYSGVFSSLEALLLNRVDAVHAGDLPALVQASIAARRRLALPVYGPKGNKQTQSTVSFIRAMFDEKRGAFRDLGGTLSPLGTRTFKLQPHDVSGDGIRQPLVKRGQKNDPALQLPLSGLEIWAYTVTRNPRPGLAWKIRGGGKTVVISSLPAESSEALASFAQDVDLLILEQVNPMAAIANTGDALGRLAYQSGAQQLAVGYRGALDTRRETEVMEAIRRRYPKMVTFVNDSQCLRP